MIDPIRIRCLIHNPENGPPDLSGFVDPVCIPAVIRVRMRKPASDLVSQNLPVSAALAETVDPQSCDPASPGPIAVAATDGWSERMLGHAANEIYDLLSSLNPVGAANAQERAPKSSPNFLSPTNPPQAPPTELPPGYTVRVMGPTPDYPNGYFVVYNGEGQPVDISTMKPPSNVTRPQSRAMTHVELPGQPRPPAPRLPYYILPRSGGAGVGLGILLTPTPAY